jgi:hypothetical protein
MVVTKTAERHHATSFAQEITQNALSRPRRFAWQSLVSRNADQD